MSSNQLYLERAAHYLTFGSAVSALFSIAVCHSLLALALAALLLSGAKMTFPPVLVPLGLFALGTMISLGLSDPSAGRPQVRKFFVFLTLLVVYSTFRRLLDVRRLMLAWVSVGALSAMLGLVQFREKFFAARGLGRNFYESYVGDRITGFMSHWMTFGGQMMIVLLLLAAFLFFSPGRARGSWAWLACASLISASLVLGFTRSIWMATAAGGVYLLWHWRRWVILLLPVAIALGLWLGPASVRARVRSAFQPHGELDSNQHRIVTWRTGWRMIQTHPWFGLGPEQVNLRFREFVPADVSQPLPQGWYGHLHNIYLHYAAERGIPTMLALMWMLGKILYDFLRTLRRLPAGLSDEKFILRGAVAVVLAILVAGLFELNLGDSEVLTMFLAVVSCGYVAVGAAGRETAEPV